MADTPLCRLDRRYVLDHFQQQATAWRKNDPTNSDSFCPLILDLGCGTGRLARPICQAGIDVLAVDLSQTMLDEVLKAPPPNNSPEHPSEQADSTRQRATVVLPLRANLVQLECIRDSVADHAICMFSTLGMIQGRANRICFLRHVARTVRPGGTLILHVHRRWAALRESGGFARLLHSWVDSIRRPESEFGDATYAYRGLNNMFMHRFTAAELKSELTAAGWTVTRIDRVDVNGEDLTASTWNAGGFFVVCRR